MKQRILGLGALLLMMAACTSDPETVVDGPQSEQPAVSAEAQLTQLANTSARILTVSGGAALPVALSTRAESVTPPAQPADSEWSGLPEWNGESAGEFKVTAPKEISSLYPNNALTVYISSAVTLKNNFGDANAQNRVHFVILKGGSLTLQNEWWSVSLPAYWTIEFWEPTGLVMDGNGPNSVSVGKGVQLIYNGTDPWEVDYGLSTAAGDPQAITSYGPTTFTEDVMFDKGATLIFNNDVTFKKDLSFQNNDTPVVFECKGKADFQGKTTLVVGSFDFVEVAFEHLYLCNSANKVLNFNDCASVQTLEVDTQNNTLNIDHYLYIGVIKTDQMGAEITFNLNDAVLALDGECPTPISKYQAGNNVISKGIVFNGKATGGQTSGVYIRHSLGINNGDGSIEDRKIIKNFKGDLVIFGETVEDEPVIKINLNNGDTMAEWGDPGVAFEGDGIIAGKVAAESAYMENDWSCRPHYGTPETEVPGSWITPPDYENSTFAHRYSATAIEFGENDLVYVSWHSNLANQNNSDGHDHGTNVGTDGSQPSVDGEEDWGGIFDVMTIPAGAPESASFDGTWWTGVFKYNHVKYDNNTLYFASTRKAGAALHVVPLVNGVPTAAAEDPTFFRLTGASANCTEVVGGQLVTMSGRTTGGINWFAKDADEDQRKAQLNDDTNNFGGKFVYLAGDKVVTLNNTANARVTIYDTNGTEQSHFDTGKALEPNDGKNVCIADANYVYVCCGRNGIWIYSYDGTLVGGSPKSANGCAFDENDPAHRYLYVATGDGLAVLDTQTSDENNVFKTVKHVHFTGNYFPGREDHFNSVTESANIKQSSNYVRVKGGVAYVAYGMYGLRMYKVADLLAANANN